MAPPRCASGTLLTFDIEGRTFDIEGRTFDIVILRYQRFNLRYRRSENDLRYQVRYYNSISKIFTFDIECPTLRYVDIEGCNIRYRTNIEAWNFDIDAIRNQRNVDIEVQNFDIAMY
jgi:hypothetical protein